MSLEAAYAGGRQEQTQQEQALASKVAQLAAMQAALEAKKQKYIADRDEAISAKAATDGLLAEYAAGADVKAKESCDLDAEIKGLQAAIDGIQATLDGQQPTDVPAQKASGWFSWLSWSKS